MRRLCHPLSCACWVAIVFDIEQLRQMLLKAEPGMQFVGQRKTPLALVQGMFFARELRTARRFVEGMIPHGYLPRASLGENSYGVRTVARENPSVPTELYLASIQRGSPAGQAGLQPGDRIQAIGSMCWPASKPGLSCGSGTCAATGRASARNCCNS